TTQVYLWDTTDFRERKLDQTLGRPCAVAFTPDGKTLAVGIGSGYARLWDAAKWERLAFIEDSNRGRGAGLGNLAWSPDRRTLVLAALSKVVLLDARANKPVFTLTGDRKAKPGEVGRMHAHCVAFSPGGQILAVGAAERPGDTGYGDRVVHLHEAGSGDRV